MQNHNGDEPIEEKRKYTAIYLDEMDKVNMSIGEFLQPYEDFSKMYKNMKNKKAIWGKKCKAYKISFLDIPELFYISFAPGRDLARGLALMELREFHPRFINKGWIQEFRQSRRARFPVFDKFADEGKVPIVELLKEGYKMPCLCCHNGMYSYEDYLNKRCFAYEDIGNPDPFAYGYVLCPHCHHKLNADA